MPMSRRESFGSVWWIDGLCSTGQGPRGRYYKRKRNKDSASGYYDIVRWWDYAQERDGEQIGNNIGFGYIQLPNIDFSAIIFIITTTPILLYSRWVSSCLPARAPSDPTDAQLSTSNDSESNVEVRTEQQPVSQCSVLCSSRRRFVVCGRDKIRAGTAYPSVHHPVRDISASHKRFPSRFQPTPRKICLSSSYRSVPCMPNSEGPSSLLNGYCWCEEAQGHSAQWMKKGQPPKWSG